MCLTFFYLNPEPSEGLFSLIVIFNRDEFFNRSTQAAQWENDILAGRDLTSNKEGGTWLGMSRTGKVAFLTNIYTGVAAQGEGRGFLVIDYLAGNDSAQKYMDSVARATKNFSPFNLVALEPAKEKKKSFEGVWYTRANSDILPKSEGPAQLSPGCHGLGNHPIFEKFVKTNFGKKSFETIVRDFNKVDQKETLEKKLFEMMCTQGCNLPDPQMDVQGSKSAFRHLHDKLSSIFVDIPEMNYGTRMQTLILIDFDLNVTFVEKTRRGGEWSEVRHEFKIQTDS